MLAIRFFKAIKIGPVYLVGEQGFLYEEFVALR